MFGSRMLPDVPQAASKRESGTRPQSNYDTRTPPKVRIRVDLKKPSPTSQRDLRWDQGSVALRC